MLPLPWDFQISQYFVVHLLGTRPWTNYYDCILVNTTHIISAFMELTVLKSQVNEFQEMEWDQ